MPNSRKFRVVGKDNKQNMSFAQKILDHRFTVGMRIVGTVSALILVVVILVMHYNNQIYTKINTLNSVNRVSGESNYYLDNKGSVVIYSEDGVSCINDKGASLWNMTFEMQKPIIEKSGEYVAVADNNGHIIYAVDSSAKVSEIDTKLPVRNIAVSENGLVAAVVEDANNSWVHLYDINGNHIVEIKATMTKTGYPLSLAMSGEVMAVSYLYVDSDKMKSNVTFYNFGGVGETSTDRIVSAYEYTDTVVPMVDFFDKDNSVAVGDNKLMFYSGSKKPVSVADIILSENIVGVYSGESSVAVVFYDTTGEHKYRVDLYKKNGVKLMSYQYDKDFKNILVCDKQIMIYNESDCMVVSNDGVEKYVGNFEKPVRFVASTDKTNKYILVTSDSLDTVRFE